MILFPKGWMSTLAPHVKDGDYTIVGSISQIHKVMKPKNLILYNWDMYSWFDYRSGDWEMFSNMCKNAIDIWYPSELTKKRAKQIFGLDKGVVIKMSVPVQRLTVDPFMGNWVLLPMRHYHKDEQFDWAQKACDELGIKLYHPDHDIPEHEYQRILAGARVILSPYKEASTGGMGVIEGLYLGKQVLASSSEWNGTREYIGERGVYFDDYEDFKTKLKDMYENPKHLDNNQWVLDNYSNEVMIRNMNDRLCYILQQVEK